MYRYAFIGMIACSATAIAEIQLQLVAEIQLPARTITWDLQHYEDSTSFGWAAITLGSSRHWEGDSLVYGLDTIWYQMRLAGALGYMLFPQSWLQPIGAGYSQWNAVRLLKLADSLNPVVGAHVVDYSNPDYWEQHIYAILSVPQDTMIGRPYLWSTYEEGYSVRSAAVWPLPPSTSQWVALGTLGSYYSNWTPVEFGNGKLIFAPSFQTYEFSVCWADLCERASSLFLTYFDGYWVDGEPSFARMGTGGYNENFNYGVLDSFTTNVPRHAVEQEDFDGTIRVLGPTGRCFSSFGNLLYSDASLDNVTLSAYIRGARGEDWLEFRNQKLYVYDAVTGALADSTVAFLGSLSHSLVTSGYDQIVTFDASSKIARVYKPFPTILLIQCVGPNLVELSWNQISGVSSYRLERSNSPDFMNAVSDYFDPSITSTVITPLNSTEFFRVSPLFE